VAARYAPVLLILICGPLAVAARSSHGRHRRPPSLRPALTQLSPNACIATSAALAVSPHPTPRLPTAPLLPSQFQLGQTIEVLKARIESDHSIPMASQRLYLGSTLLMDPMSIADYPALKSGDARVRVVDGRLIGK